MNHLDRILAEHYLERALEGKYGRGFVFAGTTDPKTRQERIRAAIVTGGYTDRTLGQNAKTHRPETYGQAFERVYGVRV